MVGVVKWTQSSGRGGVGVCQSNVLPPDHDCVRVVYAVRSSPQTSPLGCSTQGAH